MAHERGRPRSYDESSERALTERNYQLGQLAARLLADFEAMPVRKRRETVEYVSFLLREEGRSHERQCRRVPSQLAFLAYRVYGVWVDWLPAKFQTDPHTPFLPEE